VRQLKPDLLFNQSVALPEMAGRLVPAIVPVSLGDWKQIASVKPPEQPEPPARWVRALRATRAVIVGVAPLAVLLVLRSTTSTDYDKLYQTALPVAATWLFVAVVGWIDPGIAGRISSVDGLVGTLRGGRTP
jgi:hypothetical protein